MASLSPATATEGFSITCAPQGVLDITETIPPSVQIAQITSISFHHLDSITDIPRNCLYVLEEEVDAEYSGDYDGQTLLYNTWRKEHFRSLGHGAHPMPRKIDTSPIEDEVSTTLDKSKPAKNGHLKWVIPTQILALHPKHPLYHRSQPTFVSNDDLVLIKSVDVIQEFILSDGILTMQKAGTILARCDLNAHGFNKEEPEITRLREATTSGIEDFRALPRPRNRNCCEECVMQ